jgi:hypothetical protein
MSNNLQAELAQPQLQKGARAKCSTAVFPKVFTFREYNVTHTHPHPENCRSTSVFALYIINLLEVAGAVVHLHPSAQPT